MLRITEQLENGSTVRFRLDGTVSMQSLDPLIEACGRHLRDNRKMIILDMSGVDFMNDEAASRLVRLQGDCFRIINCSPFIATLLETVGDTD
jgi:anti-anti-sigma regulatory factor